MQVKQWMKPFSLFCILLLALPCLTGCWDRREIENRAIILAISIDTVDPEAEQQLSQVSRQDGAFPKPNKEMIRLTVQIALPGRISLGPGQSGGGGKEEQTVWAMNVAGYTIDDAMMNLQQKTSSKIFLGHLRVILVSEAVAKKGMQTLNDYLRRNSEIRTTTWMIIAKGNAEELLSANPKLARLPPLYILSSMEEATKIGQFPDDIMGLFWSNSVKKGQEGFLPYVEKKKETMEISGLAYFKGDKMVGSTKPMDIAAYMAVKGINPGGYRTFIKVSENDVVQIFVTHRYSKIKVKIIDGRPHVTVNIFLEFNLEEKLNEQFKINADTVKKVEQQFQKSSTQLSIDLIKQTQSKGSDIFGFGEYVRATQPQYWNKHVNSKQKWGEVYKDISVDINIKTKLRRLGMKSR